MTKSRKFILAGIAALSLGSGLAYAGKQDCGAMPHRGMSAESHAGFSNQMKERMAKHQAALHDKLQLSPGQEAAWASFTEKMKPAVPAARPSKEELAKLSVPERMERRLALMKEHEKALSDRVVATKEFYAVLTPQQQKVFNEEFRPGRRSRG